MVRLNEQGKRSCIVRLTHQQAANLAFGWLGDVVTIVNSINPPTTIRVIIQPSIQLHKCIYDISDVLYRIPQSSMQPNLLFFFFKI